MKIRSIKHYKNIVMYYDQILQSLFRESVSKNNGYGEVKDGIVDVITIKPFYTIYIHESIEDAEPIFNYRGIWIEINNIIEGDEEDSVELSICAEGYESQELKTKLKTYKKI
jgi:hypothetical protein